METTLRKYSPPQNFWLATSTTQFVTNGLAVGITAWKGENVHAPTANEAGIEDILAL